MLYFKLLPKLVSKRKVKAELPRTQHVSKREGEVIHFPRNWSAGFTILKHVTCEPVLLCRSLPALSAQCCQLFSKIFSQNAQKFGRWLKKHLLNPFHLNIQNFWNHTSIKNMWKNSSFLCFMWKKLNFHLPKGLQKVKFSWGPDFFLSGRIFPLDCRKGLPRVGNTESESAVCDCVGWS